MNFIEQQIQDALLEEEQEHTLEQALQASHKHIARLVDLNAENAGKQLLEFVTLYIQSVPNLLTDLQRVAAQQKLSRAVQPLIDIALHFLKLRHTALVSVQA